VEVQLRLAVHEDESGAALLGGAFPPSLGHTSWLTTASGAGGRKPVLTAPIVRLRAAHKAAAAAQPHKETSLNGH
jgi:predicted component of type VI protein secretion system